MALKATTAAEMRMLSRKNPASVGYTPTTVISPGFQSEEPIKPRESTVLITRIVAIVAAAFWVTPDALCSKSRKRTIVFPRQVAAYILHEDFKKSLSKIGRYFQQDHSTILHGVCNMKALMNTPGACGEILNLQGLVRTVRAMCFDPPSAEMSDVLGRDIRIVLGVVGLPQRPPGLRGPAGRRPQVSWTMRVVIYLLHKEFGYAPYLFVSRLKLSHVRRVKDAIAQVHVFSNESESFRGQLELIKQRMMEKIISI